MKVKFQRGSSQFIVEHEKSFFLVNLDKDEVVKAQPPDKPDMFLKLGYFEVIEDKDLSATTKTKILQKLTKT